MRSISAALAVCFCVFAPERGHAQMPLCNRLGPLQASGVIANTEVRETSGVADSRTHPGVLWVHNDSGDSARLFAIDESGTDLGEYAVAGAGFVDWEDIGSGPGSGSGANYLYVGDIGDNSATREFVTVYRVPEPAAAPNGAGGTLAGVEAFEIEYEIGPHDAETLFVDPAPTSASRPRARGGCRKRSRATHRCAPRRCRRARSPIRIPRSRSSCARRPRSRTPSPRPRCAPSSTGCSARARRQCRARSSSSRTSARSRSTSRAPGSSRRGPAETRTATA